MHSSVPGTFGWFTRGKLPLHQQSNFGAKYSILLPKYTNCTPYNPFRGSNKENPSGRVLHSFHSISIHTSVKTFSSIVLFPLKSMPLNAILTR